LPKVAKLREKVRGRVTSDACNAIRQSIVFFVLDLYLIFLPEDGESDVLYIGHALHHAS
jgi:hypothetical protein